MWPSWPPTNAMLVRLIAKPIEITFGQVASDQVPKKGLSGLGRGF